MKIYFIIPIFILLMSSTIFGHGGEPSTSSIGIQNEENYEFLLDIFESSNSASTFSLPGLIDQLVISQGDLISLHIVNTTLLESTENELNSIEVQIQTSSSTLDTRLNIDLLSLVSYTDWETIEHTKKEELQANKEYNEIRGGKYSYKVWLNTNEFGFSFDLDIEYDENTKTQHSQTVIIDATTGVLLYFHNQVQQTISDNTEIEEYLLRNPNYEYTSSSESSDYPTTFILALFIPVILLKRRKSH